jgi:hypothetical protein
MKQMPFRVEPTLRSISNTLDTLDVFIHYLETGIYKEKKKKERSESRGKALRVGPIKVPLSVSSFKPLTIDPATRINSSKIPCILPKIK